MGVPDVLARPTEVFGVLPRAAAKLRLRIGNILVVLRQMGVQPYAFVPRQHRCIAHQLARDGKRRTGREANAYHRAGRRVMKPIHHPDAILKDVCLALHQAVRRQAPIAFADAHRTSRWMKPQAQLRRPVDGVVQPGSIGIEIEMIGGGRIVRQRQLREPKLRGDPHLLWPKSCPNRIERLEPSKEERILPARHSPCQGLIEMVMRVHETRRDNATARVHHVRIWCNHIAHGRDHTVVDQNRGPGQLLSGHGRNNICVTDQIPPHPNLFILAKILKTDPHSGPGPSASAGELLCPKHPIACVTQPRNDIADVIEPLVKRRCYDGHVGMQLLHPSHPLK